MKNVGEKYSVIPESVEKVTFNKAGAPDLQQAKPLSKQPMCKHMGDTDSCEGGDAGAVKSDFCNRFRYNSNDWDILAEELIDFLFFQNSYPFEKRLVVVPDSAMKSFLLQKFLSSERLEIAAGVQILPLAQAVTQLLEAKETLPSFLPLSLTIEEKLWELPFLIDYWEEENKEKRIAHLSDEMAQLFNRYGLYGTETFLDFLEGWQKWLWKEVFGEKSPFSYPIELLSHEQSPFPGKLALFGFSHLSLVHLRFFSSLGAQLFHHSVSEHFWEDFLSQKEHLHLQRKLEKEGVNAPSLEQLDAMAEADHPLLRNWGKLGRQMLKNLAHFEWVEKEKWHIPEQKTLLGALKNSFLTLAFPSGAVPDDSIQIHSSLSKEREVEVLFDALTDLFQKEEALQCRDVLVLTPDLSSYAPYIEMIFGQGPYPYCIDGLELFSLSPVAQGFLRFIELPSHNYSLNEVFHCLENSTFAKTQNFSFEEIHQLRRWFESAEVHQGLSGNPNSWESGIERLLLGLSLIPQPDACLPNWPLDGVLSLSDVDLFNRFLVLFSEMQADLRELMGKKSASAWALFSLKLLRKYFADSLEKDPFFQELEALSGKVNHLKEGMRSFESFSRVFSLIGSKKTGKQQERDLNRITFTHLEGNKILPHRVIACLGLNETAFPRREHLSSLCLLKEGVPERSDEDRFAFLQLILNAKEHLWLSYERVSAEDAHAQSFSFLIDELDQYVKKETGTGLCRYDHPASKFPSSHKKKPSPFFSFSPTPLEKKPRIIDLKNLRKFARHPLSFYCQNTLQLFLKEEAEREENEFILSHLRKGLLRKSSVKKSKERTIDEASARGKLPQGIFEKIALRNLNEEIDDLSTYFQDFQLGSSDVYSIEWTPLKNSHEIEGKKFFPPLQIPTRWGLVSLIGVLPDVSDKGLLFHGEKDWKSAVSSWPLYLVYRCLYAQPLLLTKEGSTLEVPLEDPHALLSAYLDYYLQAEQTPSPLMPLWAKAVFSQSPSDFLKTIRTTAQTENGYYREDVYLHYLNQRGALEELAEHLELWKESLVLSFRPLIEVLS